MNKDVFQCYPPLSEPCSVEGLSLINVTIDSDLYFMSSLQGIKTTILSDKRNFFFVGFTLGINHACIIEQWFMLYDGNHYCRMKCVTREQWFALYDGGYYCSTTKELMKWVPSVKIGQSCFMSNTVKDQLDEQLRKFF